MQFIIFLQCLRDNVELLCNTAEMFYNAGDYNNAKSFFQRVIRIWITWQNVVFGLRVLL